MGRWSLGQCGIVTQDQNLSSWLSRSLFRARLPRSSLYESHIPWVAFPLLEPWLSAWQQAPVCWPFRRAPGILADSLLFLMDWVPADFHCQMLCRLHFLALGLWLGVPLWGWDPTLSRSDFCSWDISLAYQLPHMGAGSSPLFISSLLTRLYVASVSPCIQ